LPRISTAQKVRLWFMLGITIIMGIALIYLAAIPQYTTLSDFSIVHVYKATEVTGAFVWWLLTFIADVTLASITLYRFLHPVQRPGTLASPPYGWAPQQPAYPQSQYPQGMPPQAPYPGQNPYPPYGSSPQQ
jgi:hypothetical protein